MHATAEAYTSSSPYATWRELLRELLELGWEDPDDVVRDRIVGVVESREPALLPWVPLLANAFDVDVPPTPEVEAIAPEFRRPKLHEVVGRFLDAVLITPTLIQIEDAHLMDPASCDLLAALVNEVAGRPWLFSIAKRNVGTGFKAPDSDRVVRMDLEPMTDDDTRAMVRAATEDAPLLPHDEDLIAQRSGGNPQFLLDLVQAVASGSMLPDSVEAAATARIDSLSADDRALVRRASVLGVSFHPRMLDVVLDPEMARPDDPAWDRLSEFFEDDGDGYVRFRRAVVRDAAYEGLPYRTRRVLHRSIGVRLEQEVPDPEEASGLLSLHFFLASDNAKAYRYARIAGDRALERYAVEEAAHLYQRAIEAASRLPDVSDVVLAGLYEQQSFAYLDAGEARKAAKACGLGRRRAGTDPVMMGRLLYRQSKIEERLGGYSRALAWATRARTVLLRTDDPLAHSLASEVAAWYASVLQGIGRTRASASWARLAIAEGEATENHRALADAYDVLDTLNLILGLQTGAYWEKALALFEEIGAQRAQQRVLGNLGAGCYAAGRWDEAMRFNERAHELAVRIGDVVSGGFDLINMGEIAGDRGELDEAEALLRESLRVWRASEYSFPLGGCLAYLGRVVARAGRFDEALELYAEALEAFEKAGAHEEAVEVNARIAECLTFQMDPAAALARLDEVSAQPGAAGMFSALIHRVRGYALAQLGDRDGARNEFEEGLAVSRSRDSDFDIVQALIGLIRLATIDGERPAPELVDETGQILERLRIRAVTHVPLPA